MAVRRSRQRAMSDQQRSAAIGLADRLSNIAAAIVLCVLAGVVLALIAYFAAYPTMPPECVALYRDARSATDTAAVDRVVVRKKAALSCGAIRTSRRRPG